MKGISTHVLDTAAGRPAAGIAVTLEVNEGGAWLPAGQGSTDADGRIRALTATPPRPGTYRLTFESGAYGNPFYPQIVVVFEVRDPSQHHHIPVLLSPYGYTTYRGS